MNAVRIGAVLVGLYVCLVASVVHRHTSDWAGVTIPWGVVLAIGTTYVVAIAAENAVRAGAASFAFGWALGLLLPMFVARGDYLIGQDVLGLSFMIGGAGALAFAVLRASRVQSR